VRIGGNGGLKEGRGPHGGNAVATPLATRGRLMDLQSANYISDRANGENNERKSEKGRERDREREAGREGGRAETRQRERKQR